MKKTWVFDFDGTLADSREAAFRIFNRLAPEFGASPLKLEAIPSLRHLSVRELLKELGIRRWQLPALIRRGKELLREEIHQLRPCAGVFEQLEALRPEAERFGILTSNSVQNVELFLRNHGKHHYFEFIISCSRLSGKARQLKAIARRFEVRPGNLVYVGDEVRDVRAARKAGVVMVAVGWGFSSRQALRESQPHALVDDPASLGRHWGDADSGD